MRCCVVGCGAAGIIAAKHLRQAAILCDVFEMTDAIGGTWRYTERHEDSFGNPVHTAMYKSLRTNLPKELMEFEGLKYGGEVEESFPKSSDILEYFERFVQENQLMDCIKLGHIVTKIAYSEELWHVTVKDLVKRTKRTECYDAVLVCNGHHFKPRFPDLEGKDVFKGLQIHAKNYRYPEIFQGKTILVIGFGPSGQDITDDISKLAKMVYLSHHAKNFRAEFFQSNVKPKPDVKSLNENSVTFRDETTETIDAVLYCTGYHYTFPFLDDSCGITVDDNYVRPLHRQVVNLTRPTMAFIGLPFKTFIFPLLEVQVRAFVKVLKGDATLPSEEEMKRELQLFEEEKCLKAIPKRKYHQLESVRKYIHQLNDMSDLKDLPEVLYKLYDYNFNKRYESLVKYRFYRYKIINDNDFDVFYKE